MDQEVKQQTIQVENDVPKRTVVTTTKTVPPVIKTEHPQRVYEKKKAIFRAYQVIWYILFVIETLLIFRIALKALDANPFSGFVSLIYAITNPLVFPFQGILRTTAVSGSIFEWSTVIAAVVYAIVAFGIVHLMQIAKPVTPDEVEQVVDNP